MNRTGQPWLVAGHSVSNELVIHPSKRDSIRHDANVTDDQPITFTNDIVFFFQYVSWPVSDEKCARNDFCFQCWHDCQTIYDMTNFKVTGQCPIDKCQVPYFIVLKQRILIVKQFMSLQISRSQDLVPLTRIPAHPSSMLISG